MADDAPQPGTLSHLEALGPATAQVDGILAAVGHSAFFADFKREDIARLAGYMTAYRAEAGQLLIREGDAGDFMLLVVSGGVDIYKEDARGERRLMTGVGPGATLGEMSMIDGEPRFASCVAVRSTVFTALSRDAMAAIILENPALGAKILIKLVTLLSGRLRHTSARLLQYMQTPGG